MIEIPTLYHGTDLRFAKLPEDLRKNFLAYCHYLREVLYAHFSPYYSINEPSHESLKSFMEDVQDENPKLFENLREGLCDIMMSKISEEYEYGSLYLTSWMFSAIDYAKKAYAGGEFAFAAYALAKAAKAKGLQEWYNNEQLNMEQFVDSLIAVAEAKPDPVIYKITDINPSFLRTEQNESIERYIRNGKLTVTEFRYTAPLTLSNYEYIIVDDDFIEQQNKTTHLNYGGNDCL